MDTDVAATTRTTIYGRLTRPSKIIKALPAALEMNEEIAKAAVLETAIANGANLEARRMSLRALKGGYAASWSMAGLILRLSREVLANKSSVAPFAPA
jgi:hypothetical protein